MNQLDSDWINYVVSTGTLNDDLLILAFEEILDEAGMSMERPKAVDKLMDEEELSNDELQEVDDYIGELMDAMNEITPDNTYFGTHPEDQKKFGFWKNMPRW